MNNLEDRIAAELRRNVDAVPEASGDLVAVKRAGRRRTLVARTGIVAAAAAVTIVAIGAVALLRPTLDGTATSPTSSTAPVVATPPTTIPSTTIVSQDIDPDSIAVSWSEFELDIDAWFPGSQDALRVRTIEMGASQITTIQNSVARILSDIGAEPPYSAKLVQQTGQNQFILIEHANGSCVRVIGGSPGTIRVQDDPGACTPSDAPEVWQVDGATLIVWWGLPPSATTVAAIPDCGPAAMCIGEETPVLEGVAVLPTRYAGIAMQLTAYDVAGNELVTETIVPPPKQKRDEEGFIITLDGTMIDVEMPNGMALDTFAVERGGLIRDTTTGMSYPYRALNRSEHATADERAPPGEVIATVTDTGGRGLTTVAIGLERGTVFVTLPDDDPADVDTAAWSGAFVDLIGDGEQILVVEAGPGFELLPTRTVERFGTSVDLIGGDGLVTLSTGGCIFDFITPNTDFVGTPEEHGRVGTLLRSGNNAMWCAGDITVSVVGPDKFVDSMLDELGIKD